MVAAKAALSIFLSINIAHGCCRPAVDAANAVTGSAAGTPLAASAAMGGVGVWGGGRGGKAEGDAPIIDQAFHITIDPTCQGHQILQIERALEELYRLTANVTQKLLQTPTCDLTQLYWGAPNKADLSTPVGVFHQVLYGTKRGVQIRCDDEEKQCNSDKVILTGGFVNKEKGTMHLCPNDFQGKTQRRFIEDICQNDWTLSDNHPTVFWSAALLNLFLQLPQITSNGLIHSAAWAYPNVLNVARLDPIASAHNIDTYLYFILDNFAQQHIKGGCPGVRNSALIKDQKTHLIT